MIVEACVGCCVGASVQAELSQQNDDDGGNGGSFFRGEARMYLFLVQCPRELVSALDERSSSERDFVLFSCGSIVGLSLSS